MGCVGHGSSALAVGLGGHRGLDDRVDRRPRLPVQQIEERVLVGLPERAHRLAVHLHVEQDRLAAVVVVPHIVVDQLVVPAQLAVLDVEGEDRVGEQVHAVPLGAVAERVADGDVEQAELRIERRGLPDAAAVADAADPGRARDVPALVVLVLRDRVEVPDHLAGRRIHGQHVAARNQALAAGRPHVDHAVVDLRRGGEPVAHGDGGLDVRVPEAQHVQDDAGLPVVAEGLDRLAGRGVEGEDERAGGAVDDAVPRR